MKASSTKTAKILPTANPSKTNPAPILTHEQLEEALEERVVPDRRLKSRERPSAIVERRQAERRNTQ